jgi:hypothetical protein
MQSRPIRREVCHEVARTMLGIREERASREGWIQVLKRSYAGKDYAQRVGQAKTRVHGVATSDEDGR